MVSSMSRQENKERKNGPLSEEAQLSLIYVTDAYGYFEKNIFSFWGFFFHLQVARKTVKQSIRQNRSVTTHNYEGCFTTEGNRKCTDEKSGLKSSVKIFSLHGLSGEEIRC